MVNTVYLTGRQGAIDNEMSRNLSHEGFSIEILPFGEDRSAYISTLKHLADDLERGEKYAIVAFDEAAAECLEQHTEAHAEPKMAALVAYYPNQIISPLATYSPSMKLLVHLTTTQPFSPAFKTYKYDGVKPGFARRGGPDYDEPAASLAWHRTASVLRQAFSMSPVIEHIYEEYFNAKWVQKNSAMIADLLHDDVVVMDDVHNFGGKNREEAVEYMEDRFFPGLPPSFRAKSMRRMTGADSVVDELSVTFRHIQPMPWILPDLDPTNHLVKVMIVSIVEIRAGKIYQERMYWNQLAVLQQCGIFPGR